MKKRIALLFVLFSLATCSEVLADEMSINQVKNNQVINEKFTEQGCYQQVSIQEDFLQSKSYLEQIEAQAGVSWNMPNKSVEGALVYTLNLLNCPYTAAAQNFCLDSTKQYMYVTQKANSQGDIAISRFRTIPIGYTTIYQDSMIVRGSGHGQTLELYTSNNKTYLLISCTSKTDGNLKWSTEIGIVEYTPGADIQNEDVHRLTNLVYGNGDGTTSIGEIQRCDAALSSDNKTLIIWTKAYYNNKRRIQYSFYDFDTYFSLMKKNKKTSLKGRVPKKSIVQKGDDVVFLQGSFQGIELTNNMNMYLTSGNTADGAEPLVYKVSKEGKLGSIVKIDSSNYDNFEIEGVKIVGEKLYIMTKLIRGSSKIYSVLAINKSLF